MDKKILVVLVVVIVAAAGAVTAFALMNQGGKNNENVKYVDLGRTNESPKSQPGSWAVTLTP